jgi:hypothetical protein
MADIQQGKTEEEVHMPTRQPPDGRRGLLTKPPFCVVQLQGKTLAEVLSHGEPTETLKRIHRATTNGGHLQLSLHGKRTGKEEHFQMSARWDSHDPELACSRRSWRVWRYWGSTRVKERE